ncbi:hypothetical protein NPIL_262991 [Nephila pilipes]|uniref:Uncharacterized protein n=1 Tax=Nephila pilipes TaxID=299642 RepID=A0A8X6MIQ5_NEPPI|nr:hypothetical protein NPIL_262991 [Nephila pilipes]
MCPDECFAELWMVSPVSLEPRLSRPLEPLRSDLRRGKPLDGSRALRFLLSSWPFRLLPPVEVPVFFSFAVSRLLFRRLGLAVYFIFLCVVDFLKTTDFHQGRLS